MSKRNRFLLLFLFLLVGLLYVLFTLCVPLRMTTWRDNGRVSLNIVNVCNKIIIPILIGVTMYTVLNSFSNFIINPRSSSSSNSIDYIYTLLHIITIIYSIGMVIVLRSLPLSSKTTKTATATLYENDRKTEWRGEANIISLFLVYLFITNVLFLL